MNDATNTKESQMDKANRFFGVDAIAILAAIGFILRHFINDNGDVAEMMEWDCDGARAVIFGACGHWNMIATPETGRADELGLAHNNINDIIDSAYNFTRTGRFDTTLNGLDFDALVAESDARRAA
jgi:hypothetical protein